MFPINTKFLWRKYDVFIGSAGLKLDNPNGFL